MDYGRRVLEFDAVLDQLARHCDTELAHALALKLVPSPDASEVWEALETTQEAYELLGQATPPSLVSVQDRRPQLRRAKKGGVLGGVELAQIADATVAMRAMRQFLLPRRETSPRLVQRGEWLPSLPDLERALNDAIDGAGEVRDGASAHLGTLRQRKRGLQSKLIERIQTYTTKHRDLLSDPIYTVREGRYVVPVRAEYKSRIRGIVHDTSSSGQTVYIEPEDVLQLGNQVREAEVAEQEEIARILAKLSAIVGNHADELDSGLTHAADLDLFFAKGKLAFEQKAGMPLKSETPGLIVEGGRHPLLEAQGTKVTPLDIEVGMGSRALLITGPNTGGKTVAIKAVGLFVMMAQSGLFIPARMARLGVFSQVWADIGDEQSLQQSLSTFSGHLKNISAAIKGLRPGALVLFDEIGAGTDPAEGAALAKAILSHLVEGGAIIVASTHYGELKAFAYETEGFTNAAMEFDPKSLQPTYRLMMGSPGASHALKIAERYGIPKTVVDRAKSLLDESQAEVGRMLEKLEQAERRARIAQGEADRRQHELKAAEQKAESKLAEAEEIRRTVHARAQEAIEGTLRELRMEANALFEELKKAVDEKKLTEVRGKLKALQGKGQSKAEEYRTPTSITEMPVLEKGMLVRAAGYRQDGTVLELLADEMALVQLGPLKLKLAQAALTPINAPAKRPVKASVKLGLDRAMHAESELHLRALRAEDALLELQKFIDDSVLAGLHQVRIVHGKGGGILRQVTHDYLRRCRDVQSYREGEAGEGGQGVTIAVLKA
ncbi:MAG: endonuclease MutS2 [Methanoregulaceae archaeon]|nr:endonuclease MutS2 [Methanoregulaceae archaeon]